MLEPPQLRVEQPASDRLQPRVGYHYVSDVPTKRFTRAELLAR
jgi:hypothetical protein